MTHRVVSTDPKTADVIVDAFTWQGLDVEVETVRATTEDAVAEAARGADALVVESRTPVTDRVLAETGVRVVGRAGIGVDNVDLNAARTRGVTVVNDPDYCVDEVATHTVSLLLATWRKLRPYDESVRNGEWSPAAGAPIDRFAGKTLGFVSFGDIARRVATLVEGFDLDLVAYDPYLDSGDLARAGVEKVGFEDLCRHADLVAVTAPLTEETRGLVDEDAFRTMSRSAVVVNTGRGAVVDTEALADALDRGDIAGAGLDVLPDEPPSGLPTDHPNVVYTPHVGWYSEDAVRDLADHIAGEVTRVFRGEEPTTPVRGDW